MFSFFPWLLYLWYSAAPPLSPKQLSKAQRFPRKVGILTPADMASFSLLFSLFGAVPGPWRATREGHFLLVTTQLSFYKDVTSASISVSDSGPLLSYLVSFSLIFIAAF